MSRKKKRRSIPTTVLVQALAAVASPFLLPIPVALAHSYKLEEIAIGHIWASPPQEKSATSIAVYGPVLNQGSAPARLVGATSPVAGKVRFRAEVEGEVRWPEAIEFQPGKPLALAPWRAHIWLSDLKLPLAEGDSFDLTLDFGSTGTVTVKVVVEKPEGH